MRLLDILLAEKEGNMKTNPWMIVSLVLACVCGFLVGLLVSQPAEVSADKHDWDYTYAGFPNAAVRFDRNAENPVPEFMPLPTWGSKVTQIHQRYPVLQWTKAKIEEERERDK